MQDSNALNFEFADKFGLQSGFENSEFNPGEEKYTSGDVQIIKLLKDLQPNAKLLDYTHSNYQALYISQYYGFEGRHTPPEKPAFTYTDKNGNTKSALFKAQLNTKPGQIDTSTTFQLKLNLSAKTKECNYQLSVPYYVELGTTSTPASAVILETSDFEDLEYYIEISRGRIIDSFSKIVQRQFLSEINAYAGRASELKWLYERAPDFALDKRADEKLTKDLITLLNYDTEGWFWFFKDSSTAFIKCIEHIKDHFELFKYLAAQPGLVYRIYRSLDKVSEWNNKLEENRMIFASIVDRICKDMGYYQLAYDNNEGPASFRVDNEHYVESFVLEDGDDNGGRIKLNQIEIQSFERSPLKVSEGGVDYEIEVQPRKDDVLIKSYFLNPLQLVELRNKEGKAEYHSALFIKALADNKKWDDIEHSIRIGVDIVGVTFSAITLGAGTTPFWTAIAVADLALMGSDLILDGLRPEIEKLEHGPEFLEIWDSIYYTGGAVTGIVTTPALIQSLGRMARLATLLLKTASKGTQNFLKVAIVTAALDRGIANFTKSTTRVLFSASEVADASANILQERNVQRAMDAGAVFAMRDVEDAGNISREFLLVDEYGVILEGRAKTIRKTLQSLNSSSKVRIKKKKAFKRFIQTWSVRDITELPLETLIKNLRGYTPQANRIADLIEEEKMFVIICENTKFNKILTENPHFDPTKISPDDLYEIERTMAFQDGEFTYFRKNLTVEELMSAIVHEGSHVLEDLQELNLNIYSSEKRAYFHERAFQIATGSHVDFESIAEMREAIFKSYP